MDFVNLSSAKNVWQPTQVKTIDFVYAEDDAVGLVTLSVDFVEFDDGTTWGRDMYNSRDMLAGWREGATAECVRLHKLLKSNGPSAVFDAVRVEVSDEPPESENSTKPSSNWKMGYGSGVASIRYRLRETVQAGDAAGAERELNKLADRAEGRQQ